MNTGNALQRSALMMKITGWLVIVSLALGGFIYPPGFFWGGDPAFPHIGPAHPDSPYAALHPYLPMLGAMYLAWAILMIRGAKDPRKNVALFDYGFLANLIHGLLMIPQAVFYPNETAHFWADIPGLLALSAACWFWHPGAMQEQSD